MSLLHAIERHLTKTGIKPAPFGREAAGDPRLVFDLRRGREPRASIQRRVMALIERQGDQRCGR